MTNTIPSSEATREAKVFNVGFYIPNASVDLKTFMDYYDDRIALNRRPVQKITQAAAELLKELDPSYELPTPRKGNFTILSDGALLGGYLVTTALENYTYGPNGSVEETVQMIEGAITNSGMEHGVVMVYITTEHGYAPDYYFIMEPGETRLQQVSMEDYLKRSNPWETIPSETK